MIPRPIHLALWLTLLCRTSQGSAEGGNEEKRINHNPEAALIITSDIDNFWKAFDAAGTDDRSSVFQREYFDKGSDGLKAFKSARIDHCSFLETLAKPPSLLRVAP